jgi:hypothetical protein
MDKEITFNISKEPDRQKLYQPDGTHLNFDVIANIEENTKELYRLVNKDGDFVGKYFGKSPLIVGRKILRRIFFNTGIRNPVFYIYNTDKNRLLKLAGEVEDIKGYKKKNLDIKTENNEVIRIKRNYKYYVRIIERKQF